MRLALIFAVSMLSAAPSFAGGADGGAGKTCHCSKHCMMMCQKSKSHHCSCKVCDCEKSGKCSHKHCDLPKKA